MGNSTHATTSGPRAHDAALEGGADPTVVATWISDVQGDRLRAEHELTSASPNCPADP